MSRIKGRDTKPELTVRRTLHRLGFRFRLHQRSLPGTPDLTFPARRAAMFVHGCYWHGHTCKYGLKQSKTNRSYWQPKLHANKRRDERTRRRLRRLGWEVLVIWECQVKAGTWEKRARRFLERTNADKEKRQRGA